MCIRDSRYVMSHHTHSVNIHVMYSTSHTYNWFYVFSNVNLPSEDYKNIALTGQVPSRSKILVSSEKQRTPLIKFSV